VLIGKLIINPELELLKMIPTVVGTAHFKNKLKYYA